jgi:uncharacterized protein
MYDKIKKARIDAMKNKDKVARDFYSTMIGEIDRDSEGKSDIDAVVSSVAKKMAKNIKQNISDYEKRGIDSSKEKVELDLVSQYLPKVLSEEETRNLVTSIVDAEESPNIGKVMGALKRYGNSVDKKLASKIARELMA